MKNLTRKPRRGVLILIVLSILVMFGLLGITFVIIAGQAKRTATTAGRSEQQYDPPDRLAEEAALAIFRGSNNPGSPVAIRSLLEEMYGDDSVEGTINTPIGLVCNGQLVQFGANIPGLSKPEARVGCVLTLKTGAVRGCSFRIVGYSPSTGQFQIAYDAPYPILGPDGNLGTSDDAIRTGDSLVINGPPFTGTGVGYNPASGRLDLRLDSMTGQLVVPAAPGVPMALLLRPFLSLAEYQQGLAASGGTLLANPDYTAPDHQHPSLAMQLPNGQVPIPSFHRPELCNYWYTALVTNPKPIADFDWPSGWTDLQKQQAVLQPLSVTDANIRDRIVALKRRIFLRPLSEDHPNFTGSNLSFNPTWDGVSAGGAWDVDTDGDGIPDAIWVDFGFPVRALPDGRLVKPLVAPLIVDLDGRVNLNAHGSFAQWPTEYDPVSGQQFTGPFAGTDGNTPLALPRGEGYGPADIRLAKVVTDPTQLRNLLLGNGAIEGRYGELGRAATPQAGVSDSDVDPVGRMSRIKHFEYPNNYPDVLTAGALDPTKLTSFGSPPDLWGRGSFALDYAGQPFYVRPTTINGDSVFNGQPVNWWANEVLNNPYRLDLSRKAARTGALTGTQVDNPFTPAELERVLRRYDADAALLAGRLAALAPGVLQLRNQVTTDSYDVPTAGGSVPAPGGGRAQTIVELLQARLMQAPPVGGSLTLAQAQQQVPKLLAWELWANRRMDLNRPLGNARDTNLNGVVDEWQEAGLEAAWTNLFPGIPGAVPFWLTNGLDVNGDGAVDAADQMLARQLYARHLYVLAMLLCDADYIQPTLSGTADDLLLAGEKRELIIRRIAQWAVNVVDFRDADSAMTPFEYVLNPFTARGWNVDGDLSTDEADASQWPNGVNDAHYNPDRRVVWGCEAPEALLTEAVGFHDRRVADTAWDLATHAKRTDSDGNDPPGPKDLTLDQPLVPQGSAFFEVYCPRNPNNPVAPTDLYSYDATLGKWCLDLGRPAPADVANNIPSYPVWRMVISESRLRSANNNVAARLQGRPHSTSLEPRQYHGQPTAPYSAFSLLPKGEAAIPNVEVDRIVWFAPLAPSANHMDADRVYYNRAGASLLPCGEYAMVGPRPATAVGFVDNPFGRPSPHVIRLDTVGVVDNDGAVNYPNTTITIKPARGIVVGADPPSNWTASPYIGISISEPLRTGYYPLPTFRNPENGNAMEAYVQLPGGAAASPDADDPLDSRNGMPLKDDNILTTGTTLNYKTVFLQRLADPNRAYHPIVNPYVTVDWMPIDLTVFNGLDRCPTQLPQWWPVGQDPQLWPSMWDPDDSNPNASTNVRFCSRQRGPATYDGLSNVWLATSADPPQTTPNNALATLNYRHNLGQTLGYVNQGYGVPWTPPPAWRDAYRGTPSDLTGTPRPFPWLTWNNRPFASPLELMLVPSSHPGRLTYEFSLAYSGPIVNPYDPTTPIANNPSQSLPFSHLLNFFHSPTTTPGAAPHLYRVLDYLQVPSRFVGTDVVLNPNPNFFGHNPAVTPLPLDKVLHLPPFNTVSNYRDPGRVNINTITSAQVWEAVKNGHAGPTFDELVMSRQGYGTAPWEINNGYPTRFANPFRSGTCADLVPDLTGGGTLLKQYPVNVTLLRGGYLNPADADNCNYPLLAGPPPASQSDYSNTERNPFFRYQGLQRLGNLVTTRSNVFAVWITVGYFEVQPWSGGIDAAHPDGYTLGQEAGADRGDIKRHRAFYIFDRSIPMGFQRGMDLNVEKGVLLKRYIE